MPKRKHRAGAWLDAPNAAARTGWRLCWTDPQSGRVRKMTLDPARYPNEASREAALEQKSLSMRTVQLDKREGIVSVPIAEAVQRYLALNRKRLRSRTIADYERVGAIFAEWCKANKITFARELTPMRLEAFRTERVTMLRTRERSKRPGADPDASDLDEIRSPGTVNVELAAAHTMLKAWRRLGWTPELTTDTIADALRKEQVDRGEVEFLKPAACKRLLRAVVAHDAAMFKATRGEHAGDGTPGSTPRYEPIAPFFAVLLLSGMRFGEALSLTWRDVDLDEHVIMLAAERVKTKRARRFDMALSPLLLKIVTALHLNAAWELHARGEIANPPGTARVFPNLTRDLLEASRKRLRAEGTTALGLLKGAPPFTWQMLRRTAATVLANMRNVGPWMESQLLGHGVAVAEQRYARLLKVPPTATTIEDALGIKDELVSVWKAIAGRSTAAGKRTGR